MSQESTKETFEEGEKLSHEAFTKKAVEALRKPPFKGIHSVYSGFNQAFREYFGEDPIPGVNALHEEGKVYQRPARGGVMIYLSKEDAGGKGTVTADVIKKILG